MQWMLQMRTLFASDAREKTTDYIGRAIAILILLLAL